MKARNGRARIACECGCGYLLDMTHREYMKQAARGVMVVANHCIGTRRVVRFGVGWAVVGPQPAEAHEVAA